MDNKSFIKNLAKDIEADNATAKSMAAALATVFSNCLCDGDSVAVPGFGTFEAVKTDERVAVDAQTSQRMLMPPHIAVIFKPGSRLRKATMPHRS